MGRPFFRFNACWTVNLAERTINQPERTVFLKVGQYFAHSRLYIQITGKIMLF